MSKIPKELSPILPIRSACVQLLPKAPEKIFQVLVRIPLEILDQHNLVVGFVVHQLIDQLFGEEQAQAAGA